MHPPPQATVRDFDPSTRSGAVLLDDGTAMHFDAAAYERGGLLNLRVGQRVRLAMGTAADGGSEIVALTILTLAFPPGTDVADPGSTET